VNCWSALYQLDWCFLGDTDSTLLTTSLVYGVLRQIRCSTPQMAFDSSRVTRQPIAMALVRVSTMGGLTCWPRDASNEIVLVSNVDVARDSVNRADNKVRDTAFEGMGKKRTTCNIRGLSGLLPGSSLSSTEWSTRIIHNIVSSCAMDLAVQEMWTKARTVIFPRPLRLSRPPHPSPLATRARSP
jgi:hypothetical protein